LGTVSVRVFLIEHYNTATATDWPPLLQQIPCFESQQSNWWAIIVSWFANGQLKGLVVRQEVALHTFLFLFFHSYFASLFARHLSLVGCLSRMPEQDA